MTGQEVKHRISEWAIQATIMLVIFSLSLGALGAPTVIFVLPLVPLLWISAVAIHELGHVVAGLASGRRIILVSVGRVAWHLYHRELIVDQRILSEDAGGWVAHVPKSKLLDSRLRRSITTLGGPLVNLLTAVFAFRFLAAMPSKPELLIYPAQAVVLIFAVINAIIAVRSIVPDGNSNDGQKLVEHWRKDDMDPQLLGLAHAYSLLGYNVRLRELPDWTVEPFPNDFENRDMVRSLATLHCGRILDCESVDPKAARTQLELFRKEFGSDDWSTLCLAYTCSVHERDLEGARALVATVEPETKLPQMYHAVMAAMAMLEGDRARSQDHIWEMDKVIDAASPYTDYTFADIRRWIEAIEPLPGWPRCR